MLTYHHKNRPGTFKGNEYQLVGGSNFFQRLLCNWCSLFLYSHKKDTYYYKLYRPNYRYFSKSWRSIWLHKLRHLLDRLEWRHGDLT